MSEEFDNNNDNEEIMEGEYKETDTYSEPSVNEKVSVSSEEDESPSNEKLELFGSESVSLNKNLDNVDMGHTDTFDSVGSSKDVPENDFRSNTNASAINVDSTRSQDPDINRRIDKRAAQAAKKQEKLQKEAERRKAKQEMNSNNGGSIFSKIVKFIVAAIFFGVIVAGIVVATLKYYDSEKDNSKQVSQTDINSFLDEDDAESDVSEDAESKDDRDKDSVEGKDSGVDTTNTGKVKITDVSAIVEETMPCVVAITSTEIVQSAGNDFWSYFYGFDNNSGNQYESTGAGSGIIVGENDTELLIVTNQHVISDADTLSVQFADEKSVEATVRGQNEKQDIAVISVPLDKIEKDTIDAIKIATMGDSDTIKVGEGAIAIGNALGYGQSVTTGVISALDRTITVDTYERKVIQTDAAISPGNSGGALLNDKGELIGINCAKNVENYAEGMGYAIPITLVKDLIDDMMTKEVRQEVSEEEKGYLNIYGKDVTADLSKMYDIPEGVYIIEVIKDGAADKAGLSKYDVITDVEDESVSSMQELQEILGYYKKDEKVKITIQKLKDNEYAEEVVEVTLGGQMQ